MDKVELNNALKQDTSTYLSSIGLREIEICLRHLNDSSSRQPLVLFGLINETVKSLEGLLAFKAADPSFSDEGKILSALILQLISSDLSVKKTIDSGLDLKNGSALNSAEAFDLLISSLPKELNQDSVAGCNILKLCCQCLCMLCKFSINTSELERKLAAADIFILKNLPSTDRMLAVADLASILLRCLKNCAASAALKPLQPLSPLKAQFLSSRLDHAAVLENSSFDVPERIKILIADAANIAKKGNLIPQNTALCAVSAKVLSSSGETTPAKTPTISELAAKASKLQQKFYKAPKLIVNAGERQDSGDQAVSSYDENPGKIQLKNGDNVKAPCFGDTGSKDIVNNLKTALLIKPFAKLDLIIALLESGVEHNFFKNPLRARALKLKDALSSKIFDKDQLVAYLTIISFPLIPEGSLASFTILLLEEYLKEHSEHPKDDANVTAEAKFKSLLIQSLLSFLLRCALINEPLDGSTLHIPLPPYQNGLSEVCLEMQETSQEAEPVMALRIFLELGSKVELRLKVQAQALKAQVGVVTSNLELLEKLRQRLFQFRLSPPFANCKISSSLRLGRPTQGMTVINDNSQSKTAAKCEEHLNAIGKSPEFKLQELAKRLGFILPEVFSRQASTSSKLLNLADKNGSAIASILAFLYRL